jgi:hypothetical protein
VHPDHQAVFDLQRAAGNAAVATAVDATQDLMFGLSNLLENFEGIFGWDRIFPVRLWLSTTAVSVRTLGIRIDTALIEMETERLTQEIAQAKAQTDRMVDHNNGHPGPRPWEEMIVLGAMLAGVSGDIDLTDEVFFTRHPERRDKKLDPKDPADQGLISEWVGLRQGVVRRATAGALGQLIKAGVKGKGGGQAKSG